MDIQVASCIEQKTIQSMRWATFLHGELWNSSPMEKPYIYLLYDKETHQKGTNFTSSTLWNK